MRKRHIALVMAAVLTMSSISGCSGGSKAETTAAKETGTAAVTTAAAETTKAETEAVPKETEAAIKDTCMEESFKPFNEKGEIIRTGRDAVGETGVVTSGKVEASRAGLKMLMEGGNAIDAAVATSFALGVCEPSASGIGGGGFMLIHLEDGTSVFLDGREIAPEAATPDLWPVDKDGKVIGEGMGGVKRNGGTAVCVPTHPATLIYALEHYGTKSLEEVLAPAIELAENGYEVSPVLNSDIESMMGMLNKFNSGEGAKTFLKDGFPYAVGDTIKNPDLANTLRRIAENGLDGYYSGETAEAIVKAVQESGGVMTLEDLKTAAETQPIVREPIKGTYKDYQIISAAPVSSGGTHIVEILNILENFDIGQYEVNSAEYMHLFSEAFKMAFADRAAYMGDPAFLENGVPTAGLTDKEYAKNLAEQISMDESRSYNAGDPWPYESNDTTHFSVADNKGNMVSMTQTINGYFGSSVFPTGCGFPLNNQCSDFGIGWGLPNSVEGGKKPLSSMSPTIVLTPDGEPFAVLGSPGATKIFTTVAQMIVKLIDYDMEIQEAIDSPRIWDSNAENVLYEDVIPEEEINKLMEIGHEVTSTAEWSRSLGSVNGVLYGEDGKIYAGADPRRDGKALGY